MLNTRTRKLLTGLLRDKAIKAVRTNENPGKFMKLTLDYLYEVERLNGGLGSTDNDKSNEKEVSYNMNRGCQE